MLHYPHRHNFSHSSELFDSILGNHREMKLNDIPV